MTFTRMVPMLVCLMSTKLAAQGAKVTQLISKNLTECPGNADEIHGHNAHAFFNVPEGSVVMQVRGGKEVTLTPDQTFYEGPDDVHVVGRNAK